MLPLIISFSVFIISFVGFFFVLSNGSNFTGNSNTNLSNTGSSNFTQPQSNNPFSLYSTFSNENEASINTVEYNVDVEYDSPDTDELNSINSDSERTLLLDDYAAELDNMSNEKQTVDQTTEEVLNVASGDLETQTQFHPIIQHRMILYTKNLMIQHQVITH